MTFCFLREYFSIFFFAKIITIPDIFIVELFFNVAGSQIFDPNNQDVKKKC